jgi:hypothetical protein
MAANSALTTKRRGPGKPFEKGKSGNPSGRPKVVAEVQELARAHTVTALNTLVEIAKSGRTDAARVAAASAILDRGYGKPPQALTGADGKDLIPSTPTINLTLAGPKNG